MNKKYLSLCCIVAVFCGCAHLNELGKKFWGTSVAHLEEARKDALTKTYRCSFDECYEAVESLGTNVENLEPLTEKKFYLFLKDPIESHIVFMEIPGSIDTTEVGVFFVPVSARVFRVEVASLSTWAKEKAAEGIFKELDEHFTSL